MSFSPQHLYSQLHQVHRAQCMVEPGMQSSRIDQVCHAQLLDIPKSLEIWMGDQIKYNGRRNTDKAIYRIIYYFLFVQY